MQNNKYMEKIEDAKSKNRSAEKRLEKISALPAAHQFLPMTISQTPDAYNVKFSICHEVNHGYLNDAVDGLDINHFFKETSKKKEFHSFLELTLSPSQDICLLRVTCRAYTDYIKYPLDELLSLINPNSYELNCIVQNRRLSMGSLTLKCITITSNEIRVNKGQLQILFNELSMHEGDSLHEDLWIPKGSIEKLKEELAQNNPYETYMPK